MAGKGAVITLLAACLLSGPVCFAEDYVTADQYRRLEQRVAALEEKSQQQERIIVDQNGIIQTQQTSIRDYEQRFSKLDENLLRETGRPIPLIKDLDIGAGVTWVVQGTSNVNNATDDAARKVSRTDGAYSADISLGREFEPVNARGLIHLETGKGAGLTDDLTLYSNVNRDADDDASVRLTEAWYEQDLADGIAALTVGKLDATAYFDNNEAANDETVQFLGSIFRNSPVVEFPDNGAGVRFAYQPEEWLQVGYGLFDANADWERLFDDLFQIGEATLTSEISGRPGHTRLYGWHSGLDHTRWTDAEKTKETTFGFGLSIDQMLTDAVMLFLRYGWQNPKVYNPEVTATGDLNFSLAHSWSTGFQTAGQIWGREADVFGLAVGQIFPSGDYRESTGRLARTEGHLEAYYRWVVNEHLSFSPDIQYIWNPFGTDVADDTAGIFVGGLRTQLDF